MASEGCNGLLRAGAGLLEEAADVVFEVPRAPWREETPAAARAVLEGLAGAIHELLQREPMGADRLADELGEGPAEVAGALALLEVEGLVVRGEAQRFWAAPAPRGREDSRTPPSACPRHGPSGLAALRLGRGRLTWIRRLVAQAPPRGVVGGGVAPVWVLDTAHQRV